MEPMVIFLFSISSCMFLFDLIIYLYIKYDVPYPKLNILIFGALICYFAGAILATIDGYYNITILAALILIVFSNRIIATVKG